MGRVGLGINPKNPHTLYALIPRSADRAGSCSDDAGGSWTRISRQVTEPGRGGGFGGTPPARPRPVDRLARRPVPEKAGRRGGLDGTGLPPIARVLRFR
jgi:hypothetical protein